MLHLNEKPAVWKDGAPVPATPDRPGDRTKTMAAKILRSHSAAADGALHIRFDSLVSHDITYVGIIQTALASGLERFPLPYVLTNCHNSLCAVGGTINEDDHRFGLSAAQKFGGTFVPANLAVIHQYAREELATCGGMVLGSDSHTRYGALGTMGVGEGGPELVKQLLGGTWDIADPRVVLVHVTGAPRRGVGPHDVAIALCGAVYKNGFVKNSVLEFAGPGIAGLAADYRIGIDVMTTETACLSSIWQTDSVIEEYYVIHGRPRDYRALSPEDGACYDAVIELDLSAVEPMVALPFHPSEAVSIRELLTDPGDYLREAEKRAAQVSGAKLHLTDKVTAKGLRIEQGVIAGCSGGMYDNIAEAAAILRGQRIGSDFSLSVYPPSMPVNLELLENGVCAPLLAAGAVWKPCFCGPCFGAGDVPANDTLSARHTTRNFPNREGARPAEGQIAGVLLMDARSIAATARNGGYLASAAALDYEPPAPVRRVYDRAPYESRCYFGFGAAKPETELVYGPNIVPWPAIPPMPETLELELASVIHDPVTTTDELIPSGETSSYRSNPLRLAEFALSRRDPAYVGRAKAIQAKGVQSAIFAECPGDGSAREQAASCQRVLGGGANICRSFATKRYRSNCINWGMMPFTIDADQPFDWEPGAKLTVPGIREALQTGAEEITGSIDGTPIRLHFGPLTATEREILLDGCLMNWYAERMGR
jgi:aconitate hydratase